MTGHVLRGDHYMPVSAVWHSCIRTGNQVTPGVFCTYQGWFFFFPPLESFQAEQTSLRDSACSGS